MVVGFDLDEVIAPLPFGLKQLSLSKRGENFLFNLQKNFALQRLYNFLFRRANVEIKYLMEMLKRRHHRIVIISASFEGYKPLINLWLRKNNILVDEVYFRRGRESVVEFKKKILYEKNCFFYLEDNPRIVEEINNHFNYKRVYLYKEETALFLERILTFSKI